MVPRESRVRAAAVWFVGLRGAAGVAAVFGPGTTIAQVADFLRANARARE